MLSLIGKSAFIGDSITAAWDTAACIPGSFNVGVAGNLTAQMAARFQADVINQHPDVAFILGGTNDVAGGAFPSQGTDSVRDMIVAAKANGISSLVCTIPPNSSIPTTWGWGPNIVPAWNDMLKTLAAAQGVRVADYYPLFLNSDGSQNMALFDNPSHPNAAGRALMCIAAKAVLDSLANLKTCNDGADWAVTGRAFFKSDTFVPVAGKRYFGNRAAMYGNAERIAVAGATIIFNLAVGGVGPSGCEVLVSGYDVADATRSFNDKVLYTAGGTVVVLGSTGANSPAARTYSVSGASLRVAMGASTYGVSATGINQSN